MQDRGKKLTTRMMAGIMLGALVVVVYRACTLSLTHDEALSFEIAQGNELFRATANHHWLNTVLMGWSNAVFGPAEWALRLPNVLGFVVYALAVWRLLQMSQRHWIQLLGAALFFGNPFLLEYFSLARGYGLSIGLSMAALYWLLAAKKKTGTWVAHHFLGILCATLALAASLSLINFFIVYIPLFWWVCWRWHGRRLLGPVHYAGMVTLSVLSLVPLWLAVQRLFFLREHNELYFGSGNLQGTLNTLVERSTQLKGLWPILPYVFLTLVVAVAGYVLVRRHWNGRLFTMTLLLGAMFTGSVIERYGFDANYPHERAALYLIPLFAAFFFFFLDEWAGRGARMKAMRWKVTFVVAGLLLVVLNILKTVPSRGTQTWDFDARTKDAVLFMAARCEKEEGCSIGNNWLFEPVMNYYIRTRSLPLGNATHGVVGEPRWVYEFTKDFHDPEYTVVKVYPETQTAIYWRRGAE